MAMYCHLSFIMVWLIKSCQHVSFWCWNYNHIYRQLNVCLWISCCHVFIIFNRKYHHIHNFLRCILLFSCHHNCHLGPKSNNHCHHLLSHCFLPVESIVCLLDFCHMSHVTLQILCPTHHCTLKIWMNQTMLNGHCIVCNLHWLRKDYGMVLRVQRLVHLDCQTLRLIKLLSVTKLKHMPRSSFTSNLHTLQAFHHVFSKNIGKHSMKRYSILQK